MKRVWDAYHVVEMLILTGLIVLSGVIMIEAWRVNWRAPVAGLVLGFAVGSFAYMGGAGWTTPLITLVGAIAGPNIILWLEGKDAVKRILEAILASDRGRRN